MGRQTIATVSLCYMSNIVDPKLLEEARRRLSTIDIDRILSISDISYFIEDDPDSLFPQITYTERPEVAAINLIEGKMALLVEGIPYALIFPTFFSDLFQTSFDYNIHYALASFFRFLRYGLSLITVFSSGLYVVMTRYHPGVLPDSLRAAIASSKVETPFPIFVEVIIMSIAFYTLLEASLRTPNNMGSTISIVGGLILGDAAISAKLISPVVILVVAISALSSYVIPNHDLNYLALLLQLFSIMMGTLFGILGLGIVLLVLLGSLSKITVFGIPYLSPFTKPTKISMMDSFFISPPWKRDIRPPFLNPINKRRKRP